MCGVRRWCVLSERVVCVRWEGCVWDGRGVCEVGGSVQDGRVEEVHVG